MLRGRAGEKVLGVEGCLSSLFTFCIPYPYRLIGYPALMTKEVEINSAPES